MCVYGGITPDNAQIVGALHAAGSFSRPETLKFSDANKLYFFDFELMVWSEFTVFGPPPSDSRFFGRLQGFYWGNYLWLGGATGCDSFNGYQFSCVNVADVVHHHHQQHPFKLPEQQQARASSWLSAIHRDQYAGSPVVELLARQTSRDLVWRDKPNSETRLPSTCQQLRRGLTHVQHPEDHSIVGAQSSADKTVQYGLYQQRNSLSRAPPCRTTTTSASRLLGKFTSENSSDETASQQQQTTQLSDNNSTKFSNTGTEFLSKMKSPLSVSSTGEVKAENGNVLHQQERVLFDVSCINRLHQETAAMREENTVLKEVILLLIPYLNMQSLVGALNSVQTQQQQEEQQTLTNEGQRPPAAPHETHWIVDTMLEASKQHAGFQQQQEQQHNMQWK